MKQRLTFLLCAVCIFELKLLKLKIPKSKTFFAPQHTIIVTETVYNNHDRLYVHVFGKLKMPNRPCSSTARTAK